MPDEIELKFSANVAGLDSTTKIQNADGKDWTSGEAQIVNNSMIQKTSPDVPAGEYTVLWRAVSSDSHPIEGTLTFTVTGKQRHRLQRNPPQRPQHQRPRRTPRPRRRRLPKLPQTTLPDRAPSPPLC